MFSDLLIGLFLSISLGAFVGIQREMRLQKGGFKDFAGFRTFTFIALLGYLLGFLAFDVLESEWLIVFSVFGFFILISMSYLVLAKKYKEYVSETSQITALITFLIGILVSINEYYVAILITIIIATFLVLGNALHSFAKKIKVSEIYATMKFAIISFIVLPILPNKSYGPLDIPKVNDFLLSFFSEESLLEFAIFNLYHIWLMVVLISGITYIGYIFMKLLGSERGILLTGFLGGLMSSTALTSTFSIESRNVRGLSNPLAIGIILASSIMFFRIIFEVTVVNTDLLLSVLFLSLMGFVGLICAVVLLFRNKNEHVGRIKQKSPFMLWPAIKFACFFVFVIFMTKFFGVLLGDKGIYFVSFLSGVADVDVITLTLSKLALDGSISNATASIGIFIAAISNTLFKAGITFYMGSKGLSRKTIISYLVIIVVGFMSLVFI